MFWVIFYFLSPFITGSGCLIPSNGGAGADARQSLSEQMDLAEGGDVAETIRTDVAGEIASEVELVTKLITE